MRALTIDAHGGLDKLRLRDDLPVPQLQRDDEVRVRIRAAALNRLDLWVVGGIPGVKIGEGWILGSDGAGVVEEVGAAGRGEGVVALAERRIGIGPVIGLLPGSRGTGGIVVGGVVVRAVIARQALLPAPVILRVAITHDPRSPVFRAEPGELCFSRACRKVRSSLLLPPTSAFDPLRTFKRTAIVEIIGGRLT